MSTDLYKDNWLSISGYVGFEDDPEYRYSISLKALENGLKKEGDKVKDHKGPVCLIGIPKLGWMTSYRLIFWNDLDPRKHAFDDGMEGTTEILTLDQLKQKAEKEKPIVWK